MMIRLLTPLALLLAVLPARAEDAVKPRAVIELFTSQGCSACPPADRIAAELSQDPSLIVLTLPVDYWDYLGWKDTLGSAAHSARQRAYAMARGDRKVYTPQVVIDGVLHRVGSNAAAIATGIDTAAEKVPTTLSVPVEITEDGDRIGVKTGLPPSADHAAGEVWLVAIARERTVAIGRGENNGRTVTYRNVVRKMTRLGPWKGKSCEYSIPKDEALGPEGEDYVVLVQAGSGGLPGPILGAAQARRR